MRVTPTDEAMAAELRALARAVCGVANKLEDIGWSVSVKIERVCHADTTTWTSRVVIAKETSI